MKTNLLPLPALVVNTIAYAYTQDPLVAIFTAITAIAALIGVYFMIGKVFKDVAHRLSSARLLVCKYLSISAIVGLVACWYFGAELHPQGVYLIAGACILFTLSFGLYLAFLLLDTLGTVIEAMKKIKT